jgi:hypothetical protein
MAMGEAFTAAADDLDSLNSNPAGLARLEQRQAMFAHADLFEGARYDFAGYGHPLSAGTLGVSIRRLSHGTLEGRDAGRQPTGPFSAADTALSVGFGGKILEGEALAGLQVKFIESRLADTSARTAAFDAGVLQPYSLGGRPAMVGVSVLNLGQGLRYGESRGQLPLALSGGAAVRLTQTALLAADVRHRPHSGKSSASVGAEYSVVPAVTLRAGYTAFSEIGSGALGGLGMGLGLKFGKAALDYAFAPAGELGNAQRVSFSMRF